MNEPVIKPVASEDGNSRCSSECCERAWLCQPKTGAARRVGGVCEGTRCVCPAPNWLWKEPLFWLPSISRAVAHAAATAVLAAALFHCRIFPSRGFREAADGGGVGGEVAP